MRVLGASEVIAALDFPGLIEALRRSLRAREPIGNWQQRTALPAAGGEAGALQISAAWQAGRHFGVELATDFPAPAMASGTVHHGAYLLLDRRNGERRAVLDGAALTLRRLAATSALAAAYLARADCERLLLIGATELASHLLEAHAAARPIRNVLVWDRDVALAAGLARRLTRRTLKVAPTEDLEGAVRGAHIVCCTGDLGEPVLRGHWLPQGAHVDLVLGAGADALAADDATLDRSRCYVDRLAPASTERNTPVSIVTRDGTLVPVAGDLAELVHGRVAGRSFTNQITLFRSTGLGFLDLAAAEQAFDNIVN
ncbi:MAG TPA: hypothetical protein VMU42_08550 [Candidatus Sulfotelmatobacter sp.]|nr:hypothetical protein [Candidatus Sulfotelmatobacter sp.]